MLTDKPDATATFKFTGIAIYFYSPRWPYNVNVLIKLDVEAPEFVNLTDPSRPDVGSGSETVNTSVVWSRVGLENIQHTLIVSVKPGQPYAIVDGIEYTKLDPTPSSGISSSSIDASSSSSTSSSSSSTSSYSSLSSGSDSWSFSTSSTVFWSSTTFPVPSFIPPNNSSSARQKSRFTIIGSTAGIVALLLILIYLVLRRRRVPKVRTIDGSTTDGDSVISNENGEGQQLPWAPRDGYSLVQPYEHGFGNMTSPQLSPSHSAQQMQYAGPQTYYHPFVNRSSGYGYASFYTGGSPPPMAGPHVPLLANESSSSGVNVLTSLNVEDVPSHLAAPASEHPGRRGQRLVVRNGSEYEMEAYEESQTGTANIQPPSPTDESSDSSYQIPSVRRSI